ASNHSIRAIFQATTTAVGDAGHSARTVLLPNLPNPFQASTGIPFELAQAEEAEVAVYTVQGRLVKHLGRQLWSAGRHTLTWDGTDERGGRAPAGVYLVALKTAQRPRFRKIMLVH